MTADSSPREPRKRALCRCQQLPDPFDVLEHKVARLFAFELIQLENESRPTGLGTQHPAARSVVGEGCSTSVFERKIRGQHGSTCKTEAVTEPRAANAAEQISATLRREIIDHLHEGDRIGLAEELAKRFGVSSATVRQALRVLEADGLATVRRGNSGGYFASTPSVQVVSRSASALLQRQGTQLADLLICAQLLGPELAALAAISPNVAGRKAVVAYVEQAWSGHDDADVDRALEVSVELSRRMGELCGSPPLALFAAVLTDLVMDIQRQVRPMTPPDLLNRLTRRVHESQVLLARAIADGNMPAARQAQHLHNSGLSV